MEIEYIIHNTPIRKSDYVVLLFDYVVHEDVNGVEMRADSKWR